MLCFLFHCIILTATLCLIYRWQRFPLILWATSLSTDSFLCHKEDLNFMRPSLQMHPVPSECYLKTHYLFSFSIFRILVLVFRFIGIEFCVGWELELEFHSFTCQYPGFQVLFVKDDVFSSMYFCLMASSMTRQL